ncbi:hypothetical protein ABZX51_009611 [Aspergillus tubingensis]
MATRGTAYFSVPTYDLAPASGVIATAGQMFQGHSTSVFSASIRATKHLMQSIPPRLAPSPDARTSRIWHFHGIPLVWILTPAIEESARYDFI